MNRDGVLQPPACCGVMEGSCEVDYKEIRIEIRNQTAWIYLNRPKEMNAISMGMLAELDNIFATVADDPGIKVVVLSGEGKAFCAGADLKSLMESLEDPNWRGPDFLNRCETVFNGLRSLPAPVIAAVNGMALAGGLELIMCCDLVYAAQSAKMGDCHANFGVFPGAGGAAVLPGKIGLARAKHLLFTGEMISARQMMEYGLVNQVVGDDQLETTVQELADRLCAKSSLVLARMKTVANQSLDQTQAAALRNELLTLRDHLHSHDMHEGLAAFREKRPPEFKGN